MKLWLLLHDTDSFDLAMNDDSLDEILKCKLSQMNEASKTWLATEKFRKRTLSLGKL